MRQLYLLAFLAAASAFVILDTTPQCDLEWIYYDYTNSCYYQGDYQNFDGAEKSCNTMGGHLASVLTQFESSFVQALTESGEKQNQEGMTWIGLHFVNNAWVWTDGSPFQFTYWMKGAPDKPSKYGCAILMQDDYTKSKGVKGQWDSTECKNKERKYVCKKPSNW